MSGRSRHLRDGVWITNRKTDRRQSPTRPLIERLHELNEKHAARDQNGWDVTVCFLLPKSLEAFVSSGQFCVGIQVFRGFVQISGDSTERCFERAQSFFATVAKQRSAFTLTASIMNRKRPGEHWGRHMTIVSGNVVVTGGMVEPKVFEGRG